MTDDDELAAEASARQSVDNSHQSQITANANAISQEVTERQTAVTALQTQLSGDLQEAIDAEELARINADSTLQSNIDAEATARTNADTALQNNINAEATSRAMADTTLQNNINSEATTRGNADTTLQNNINAEATARANADTTLQNNINAEATTRANADTNIQTQVTANTNKLTANDNLLIIKGMRKTPVITVTSASTMQLDNTMNSIYMFTGNTAGQILKMPNATTLAPGRSLEVWNFSSQVVTIKDYAGNNLALLKANAQSLIVVRDISTNAGLWGLSYTSDSGNTFGTSAQFVSDDTETSSTSQTTFAEKLSLTTPADMALGDYMINFQFMWRSANANRAMNVAVQQDGVDLTNWNPFTANISEKPLLAGFKRIQSLSGQHTFTLNFRVGVTATTVFMSEARMYLWRIA